MTSVDKDEDFRAGLLLSFQRALWDAVTPELRGVAVGWDLGMKQVFARFTYDCPGTSEMQEMVSQVETQVLADLAHNMKTVFNIEELPMPSRRELRDMKWWVYLRHEPPLLP